MSQRYKWSPKQVDRVYKAINEGSTDIKSLAKAIGVSRESIYNWCKKSQEFREAIMFMKMERNHAWSDKVSTYGDKPLEDVE